MIRSLMSMVETVTLFAVAVVVVGRTHATIQQ
jgi:hypothetical protein